MNETPRPVRLRLSRSAGFNLQITSIATNALPAVNVSRPSRWGNWAARRLVLPPGDASVTAFKSWLENEAPESWTDEARSTLKNKNLACWCALDLPCHADILLTFANSASRASSQPIGGVMRPRLSCDSPE
ncbi:MAG: DUF4326 domain-containing protein [Bradyrhizobium sp.]|nr:DUF4326 domain-containing protein [Bradyrhizobium sp.]